MKLTLLICLLFFLLVNTCAQVKEDNAELKKLVAADQADRSGESDEKLAPNDDLRRQKVFELLAQNKIMTPKDKYNASIILHHTGMVFIDNQLKSKSVENHYLAYQLAKAAFEEGYQKAQYLVAVTYDRYSWMAYGYQKYGTQTTFKDDKEVWVTIDSTTADEERARYQVPPLQELLKLHSMQ